MFFTFIFAEKISEIISVALPLAEIQNNFVTEKVESKEDPQFHEGFIFLSFIDFF